MPKKVRVRGHPNRERADIRGPISPNLVLISPNMPISPNLPIYYRVAKKLSAILGHLYDV
jgi:hypothetical protein